MNSKVKMMGLRVIRLANGLKANEEQALVHEMHMA